MKNITLVLIAIFSITALQAQFKIESGTYSADEEKIWAQIESTIATIMETEELAALKKDAKEGYDQSWTLTTDEIEGLNKTVNFTYKEISSDWFPDDVTRYISYNVYDMREWISAERTKEQQESDILMWEQVIDNVLPKNMIKLYKPYDEATVGTMGAMLGEEKGVEGRKHILDEVFWLSKSEKNSNLGSLEGFHIQLEVELEGYNDDKYTVSLTFRQAE